MDRTSLAPILTPAGHLQIEPTDDSAASLSPDLAQRLTNAFARGSGHGLLQLGAAEVQTPMPAVLVYWREFASRFVVALRTLPNLPSSIPAPPNAELEPLVLASPIMMGAEYLSSSVLESLWSDLNAAFQLELSESGASTEEFLKGKN